MPSALVIDDDPEIRSLLRQVLQQAGFDAWTEPDGEAGLRAACKLRPDVILLDWLLPGLSGLEICRAVRAHPDLAPIPVILITARDQEFDRELGYAAGVDDYVTKPFRGSDVRARVERVLAGRSTSDR